MTACRKGSVRVGLVGAGFIAGFHLKALRELPHVSVVAVCDNDSQKAAAFQSRWNLPGAYTRLSDMFAAGVDVVHILVPPTAHAACARECLEAGCHVFLEKPATVDSDEAARLLETAGRAGRTVGINHNFAYHPALRQAVRGIRDWKLGRVEHVTAIVNVPLRQLNAGQHDHWMFARPGNIVLEQMPHPLSQVYCLLGSVRSVSAVRTGYTMLKTGAPFYDTWMASMECERGTAQCMLSVGREFSESLVHIIGQDGAILVDVRRNTVRLTGKSRFLEPVDHLIATAGGGLGGVRQGLRNFTDYALAFVRLKSSRDPFFLSMHGSITAFYEALAAGKTPESSLAQGASIIETCEMIARSAEQSAPIRAISHAANF